MKYVVIMGTMNFPFYQSEGGVRNLFKSGVYPVKEAPHTRRPKTATSPKIVEKVKDSIGTDTRFTTRHIDKCVGISVGASHTIFRCN